MSTIYVRLSDGRQSTPIDDGDVYRHTYFRRLGWVPVATVDEAEIERVATTLAAELEISHEEALEIIQAGMPDEGEAIPGVEDEADLEGGLLPPIDDDPTQAHWEDND